MTPDQRNLPMTNHNAENERIKRRYFAYLKEAKRRGEPSLDAAAKALRRFESYTRFRKENEKFGRLRVTQDLKAKGVHGDIIQGAVGAAYDQVNEEQLARDFLKRKRLSKPEDQKQAARIFRTLARAGFPSRIIFRILKTWNVDDETITALEEESRD